MVTFALKTLYFWKNPLPFPLYYEIVKVYGHTMKLNRSSDYIFFHGVGLKATTYS